MYVWLVFVVCCASSGLCDELITRSEESYRAWVFVVIIIIIIIISVMELGHLLTRSGLTYPEVSSKVCHDSFCQLEKSVSLPRVIYYEAFYLHVVSIFSCIPVICPKLVLFLRVCAWSRNLKKTDSKSDLGSCDKEEEFRTSHFLMHATYCSNSIFLDYWFTKCDSYDSLSSYFR